MPLASDGGTVTEYEYDVVSVEVVRIVGIPSLDVEVVVDIFESPADEVDDVDEVTWLVREACPELFVVFELDSVDSVVVAETIDEVDFADELVVDFVEDFVDFVLVDFSVVLSDPLLSRAAR